MTKGISEKFSRFCAAVILILLLCLTVPTAIWSLGFSVSVTTGGKVGELVDIVRDNLPLNIALTMLAFALVCLLSRWLDRVPLNVLLTVLTSWILLLGGAIVCSAKLQPTEDPYIISFFARQSAQGVVAYYFDYFTLFPYQFGLALYDELFFRLFNLVLPNAPEGYSAVVLQLGNVLLVAVGYIALVKISVLVFKKVRVGKCTALLLFLFLPPILSATLMYGNIPSFAFSVLSLWFFLLHREKDDALFGVLCAVSMCLAVILKLNALIFVIALGIVWLIDLIGKPSWKSSICLILLVAGVLCTKSLPQKFYERRADKEFGNGVPQLGWMAMGCHEGLSSFGWYSPTYTARAYEAFNYDPVKTSEYDKEAILEQITEFQNDPWSAFLLFGKKHMTQWGDPTCQSLWTNQVRPSYNEYGRLYNILFVDRADAVYFYMNILQQLVLLLFCAGLFLQLRQKDLRSALLPLVVLGAMLYHLIFEAKAQYALCYYPLMLPTAAFTLESISWKKERNT